MFKAARNSLAVAAALLSVAGVAHAAVLGPVVVAKPAVVVVKATPVVVAPAKVVIVTVAVAPGSCGRALTGGVSAC